MTVGTHVTVWFGRHEQDLLAILKQPGVNASGMIKIALRAYIEGNKPAMIATAVVDELLSRGPFFVPGGEFQDDDEVEGILAGAVQQFANEGSS